MLAGERKTKQRRRRTVLRGGGAVSGDLPQLLHNVLKLGGLRWAGAHGARDVVGGRIFIHGDLLELFCAAVHRSWHVHVHDGGDVLGTNDFDADEQLRSVEARRAQHATVGGWQCAACSTGEYKVSVFCPTCGGPRQPAPSAPPLGTGFGGAAAAPLIVSAAAGTGYGGAAPLATTASGTVVFGASPDNNSKHIAMTL